MRHFKIMGLCLVAAFALAAVFAAGSASAAEPEWAGCVPQKHGNFTEEKCATVAEKHGVPDHKGHYELKSGQAATCIAQKHGNFTEPECKTVATKHGVPDHKGHYEQTPSDKFTGEAGASKLVGWVSSCDEKVRAKAELPGEALPREDCEIEEYEYEGHHEYFGGYKTTGRGLIECESEHATGEAAGSDEVVNISVRFKGCTTEGAPATTAGLPAGEVQVNPLKGRLGYVAPNGKANHEVGVLLEPVTAGSPFAEFEIDEGTNIDKVGAGNPSQGSFWEGIGTATPGEPNGHEGIISPITPVNQMTRTFTQEYRVESTTRKCTVYEEGTGPLPVWHSGYEPEAGYRTGHGCDPNIPENQAVRNIPDAFEGGQLEVLEQLIRNNPEIIEGWEGHDEGEWGSAGEEVTNVNTLKAGYAEIKA